MSLNKFFFTPLFTSFTQPSTRLENAFTSKLRVLDPPPQKKTPPKTNCIFTTEKRRNRAFDILFLSRKRNPVSVVSRNPLKSKGIYFASVNVKCQFKLFSFLYRIFQNLGTANVCIQFNKKYRYKWPTFFFIYST